MGRVTLGIIACSLISDLYESVIMCFIASNNSTLTSICWVNPTYLAITTVKNQ